MNHLSRAFARFSHPFIRTSIVAVGMTAACGLAAAATSYQLTKFADPRGARTDFAPSGINNNLVIAGSISPGTEAFGRGFTLSGGNIAVFEVPAASSNFTFADDINNSGVVAGSYRSPTGVHGFTLNNGVYATVDVPGAYSTAITGINDLGQLVGEYKQTATGNTLGFVKSGDNFTFFDAAQTQPNTLATGINDAGQVVGTISGGGAAARGFTWTNGVFEFFDAPNGYQTQAGGINDKGQVVGSVQLLNSSASDKIFVKDGASFTTLSLPSSWNARQTMATDITDDGVVVGYFTDNSTNLMYGFLATPVAAVPEPSSVMLMLAGALGLRVLRQMPGRREPTAV